MWPLLVAWSWASDPAGPRIDVIPWAAPWDVQAQYDAWRVAAGRAPATLACEPLWPDQARLCYRRVEAGRLVRVHVGELTAAALTSAAHADAATWVTAQLEVIPVEGMGATYRRLRDAEGRVAFAITRPEAVAGALGLPYLAALPSTGVFLAWPSGDSDLDRVMAVATREIYAASPDAVSPVVHVWDGQRWAPFAEAVPRTAP